MMKSSTVAHTAQGNLLALGVPWALISLPTPYLWLLPQTSDPATAGVQEIIRAIQRGLVKIGLGNVRVTGILDAPTASALRKVAGRWENKSWIQIITDVVSTMRDPERKTRAAAALQGGLGNYIQVDFTGDKRGYGPFPGRMIGTPPGPLGLGDTADGLTWGAGVSGTGTCVPIPKTSGVTFQAFTDLQRQINRVLTKFGGGRISEDGVIGTGTVSALRRISQHLPLPGTSSGTCAEVAGKANSIRSLLRNFADTQLIPGDAGKTPPAPTGHVGSGLSKDVPPPPPDSGAFEAIKKYGIYVAIAGAAAVAFHFAFPKKAA